MEDQSGRVDNLVELYHNFLEYDRVAKEPLSAVMYQILPLRDELYNSKVKIDEFNDSAIHIASKNRNEQISKFLKPVIDKMKILNTLIEENLIPQYILYNQSINNAIEFVKDIAGTDFGQHPDPRNEIVKVSNERIELFASIGKNFPILFKRVEDTLNTDPYFISERTKFLKNSAIFLEHTNSLKQNFERLNLECNSSKM